MSPFPRFCYPHLLACVLLFGMAAQTLGSVGARGNPFAGDVRLEASLSLSFREKTFPDFLADISEQTGIRFFTDTSVQNDRVTIFMHERPLGECLLAVARLYGFEWRRLEQTNPPAYLIAQPQSAREEEQAERERAASRLIRQVRLEAELLEKNQLLSPQDAEARAGQLAGAASAEADPGRRHALQSEAALCLQAVPSLGHRVAFALVRRLDDSLLTRALWSGRADLCYPADGIGEPIPTAVVEEIRTLQPPSGEGTTTELVGFTALQFRLMGDVAREPAIRWQLTLTRRGGGNVTTVGYSGTLPLARPVEEPLPAARQDPEGWRTDPRLAHRLSLDLEPDTTGVTAGGTARRELPRTLGAILERVARTRSVNIIADALGPDPPVPLPAAVTLGEFLHHIARASEHTWGWDGEYIVLRSRQFALRRWAEPPWSDVSRWSERARQGALSLSDLTEIAALPDHQYATLMRLTQREAVPREIATANQARAHLQLWRRLPAEAREKAATEGLSLAELAPEIRSLARQVIQDPTGGAASVFADEAIVSPEMVDRLRMRMEQRDSRLWAARRGSQILACAAPSLAEAHRQLRESDPQVRRRDVRQVVSTTYIFTYERERPIARAWITLPPRWEDPPPGDR